MSPETIFAAISCGLAAFAGLNRALSGYQDKVSTRFIKIEEDISRLERNANSFENSVIRDYVLKQDFLREMQAVHQKLDRIWDHMIHRDGL